MSKFTPEGVDTTSLAFKLGQAEMGQEHALRIIDDLVAELAREYEDSAIHKNYGDSYRTVCKAAFLAGFAARDSEVGNLLSMIRWLYDGIEHFTVEADQKQAKHLRDAVDELMRHRASNGGEGT